MRASVSARSEAGQEVVEVLASSEEDAESMEESTIDQVCLCKCHGVTLYAVDPEIDHPSRQHSMRVGCRAAGQRLGR